ncbi:sulfurtransferase [Microbacterium sp. RU33B]|uniref:sulfurtransferase n=1 Tax=Microbacterium sp. RU33B TaxID=1907390 RepID=UPI00095CAD40|nr:sulfurtransferase [Microbacterium sp. RU33B]SIT87824.1 thiosulfate/3-mercaptopyruvate sulfurtransferase [Microbacterium sp. RU33B]
MPHLISPQELAEDLRAHRPVRLLDVRWRLDQPEGRPAYLEGHLPGAVYVDLDGELADRADPAKGRHPLPSRAQLEEAARRWGVNTGDAVVAYDDLGSVAAARAWWLLSRAGVDVRVLDGGLRGWLAEGGAVETGDVRPDRGDVELSEPTDGVIDIDDAADWSRHGVLIDVRAPERYRGESEPLDPVAGHIPGAVNLPTSAQTEAGRFRSAEEIRAAFESVGAAPGADVAAYCGSGIAATHTALAGAIAGIDVAVFPGSWSQWSRTRGRDVATGPTPSREVSPL